MKKQFSTFIVPNLVLARKRINKNTEVIRYQMDEKYQNLGKGKYYHIKTYGCQGNLADSEKISGIMEMMGFIPTISDEEADVIIFNTCAIRQNAENRVFGELGRIKNLKKIKTRSTNGYLWMYASRRKSSKVNC